MRWIAHVDMDSFYVSVERLKNKSLIGKPVVVGGRGRRGVVASSSYEARKFGVRSAMPMGQALRLCPALIVVSPDFTSYSRLSRQIFSELEKIAPLIEQVSVDEAYLDFTGCERLYTTWEESARRVKEAVKRVSGLTSTVGVSTNKLVSKIASDHAKPDGLLVIAPGDEEKFLAPQSIRKIPGIGPKTAVLLESRGYMTCRDLAAADTRLLKQLFGDYIIEHQLSARGIDDSPVSNEGLRKSLSSEETFDYDEGDMAILDDLAKEMAEELATGLREESLKARTVGIKFRYADFTTLVRAVTLGEPTHLAREIAASAIHLLHTHKDPNLKLRLFGVSARNLVEASAAPGHQMDLFENPIKREKEEKLERVKDELKKKFGKEILGARPRGKTE